MTRLEKIIAATLSTWRTGPFVWGRSDCMLSAADYWLLANGADPAKAWRGTYAGEKAARALMAAHGGGLGLMAAGLNAVAARLAGDPHRGDLVCAAIGGEQVPGLCLGNRAAFRKPGSGYVDYPLARLKILGVWRPS